MYWWGEDVGGFQQGRESLLQVLYVVLMASLASWLVKASSLQRIHSKCLTSQLKGCQVSTEESEQQIDMSSPTVARGKFAYVSGTF